MKKIFLYLVIMAAVVACDSAEFESDSFSMITETISGTYGPATKATIADLDASFKWSVGDNVAVHVSKGQEDHKYVLTSGDGGASQAASSASFKVTYDSGYSRDAFAVFPSTIISECTTAEDNYGQSDAQGEHTLDVALPSSYTLSQVQGEVSPCPMIATNSKNSFSWNFYQLCSLLRLTVDNIPETAKRLVIDFDGKNVAGNFSIPSPKGDGTSTIALTNASGNNSSIITITKDGSDAAVLGETSLVLNIPLPVGDYSKITVYAYNAISGGNVVSGGNSSFSYTAANTKAVKKTASLSDQSVFTFTFRDKDTQTNLGGLRFVRIFSCQNKLYNGSTTFGPYTVSSATGEDDMANPVHATLKFSPDNGDQLAFQVIDANGKVYSGLYNAPTGGFTMGAYDLTVDVKAYTFTALNGKKVYFSPGDLGVDNDVYSFTEPFTSWGHSDPGKKISAIPAKRVYFNYTEVNYTNISTGHEIYGVKWRIENCPGANADQKEWNYIISYRTMNSGVARYYKVTIPGHQYCLLLPPDETESSDIGDDLTSGTVTEYLKYMAKGFVLLMNTNRILVTNSSPQYEWGSSTIAQQGWYWTIRNNNSSSRFYFYWTDSNTPVVDWGGNQWRLHVRYIRDVQTQ